MRKKRENSIFVGPPTTHFRHFALHSAVASSTETATDRNKPLRYLKYITQVYGFLIHNCGIIYVHLHSTLCTVGRI